MAQGSLQMFIELDKQTLATMQRIEAMLAAQQPHLLNAEASILAALGAGAAAATQLKRRVSRREFFGLGWRRRVDAQSTERA